MNVTDCRTAAVIHLDRLGRNIENIKGRLAPGVELVAVVKADSYGHGAAGLYPTFREHGIRQYAVAIWDEGAALRRAGAEEEPIMILGDTWDDQLPELLRWRLTPAIIQEETAEKLNALAGAAGVIHPIQIKLDTGMSRIGFPADERALAPIRRIAAMENLRITGVFSHFPRADELDVPETEEQFGRFCRTVALLREAGVEIPMAHIANSAALLLRPESYQLDAVRPGDAFYGLNSIDPEPWSAMGFEEILSWHSYVAMVKTIPAGTQVGYGGTWVAPRETRLATIPVGFVDGYSRALSNRGYVLIRGQEAPIRGRVCMDQFMVDVTDIPDVRRGDPVTLLGGSMTVQRMSDISGLSIDEIVCGISGRVPRIYTAD